LSAVLDDKPNELFRRRTSFSKRRHVAIHGSQFPSINDNRLGIGVLGIDTSKIAAESQAGKEFRFRIQLVPEFECI
jgi:hypothetical protein